MQTLRICLLHLAPVVGEIEKNWLLLNRALTLAAARQADWVITPELCVSGYQFSQRIGTDWITPQPDSRMAAFCQRVRALQLMVFLAVPERDTDSERLYNSVFLIDADGQILGKHRKINTRPEPWASPGQTISPILWHSLKVGLLLCSDAYTAHVSKALKAQGAHLLISPAAWGPGLHGPAGEWEQRTRETGLSLIVCNRTGQDGTLNFCQAESLVVKDGKRLLSHRSDHSAVLTFDWDVKTMSPLSSDFQQDSL